jgi:hypothetical protein
VAGRVEITSVAIVTPDWLMDHAIAEPEAANRVATATATCSFFIVFIKEPHAWLTN